MSRIKAMSHSSAVISMDVDDFLASDFPPDKLTLSFDGCPGEYHYVRVTPLWVGAPIGVKMPKQKGVEEEEVPKTSKVEKDKCHHDGTNENQGQCHCKGSRGCQGHCNGSGGCQGHCKQHCYSVLSRQRITLRKIEDNPQSSPVTTKQKVHGKEDKDNSAKAPNDPAFFFYLV